MTRLMFKILSKSPLCPYCQYWPIFVVDRIERKSSTVYHVTLAMAHTFKALSLWAQSNNNWKEFPIKPQLDAEKVAEGFEDGRWAVGKAGDSRRRPHGPALSTSVSRIWNICMGKLSLWLYSTHIGVSRHLGSIVSVSSEQSWDIGVSICQYPVRCLANLRQVALAGFLLGSRGWH